MNDSAGHPGNTSWTTMNPTTAEAATTELFVLVLVTSFVLVSAAVLRMVLHSNMVHGAWTGYRGILLSTSETDALRAYPTLSYGTANSTSIMTHGHARARQALYNHLTNENNFDGSGSSYERLLELSDMLGTVKHGLTDEQISVLPTYRYRRHRRRRDKTVKVSHDIAEIKTVEDYYKDKDNDIENDSGSIWREKEQHRQQDYETRVEETRKGTVEEKETEEVDDGEKSDCDSSCSSDERACAICRDDIQDMDVIRTLPCGDEFHADCIAPWLKQQASCPLCRNRFA